MPYALSLLTVDGFQEWMGAFWSILATSRHTNVHPPKRLTVILREFGQSKLGQLIVVRSGNSKSWIQSLLDSRRFSKLEELCIMCEYPFERRHEAASGNVTVAARSASEPPCSWSLESRTTSQWLKPRFERTEDGEFTSELRNVVVSKTRYTNEKAKEEGRQRSKALQALQRPA